MFGHAMLLLAFFFKLLWIYYLVQAAKCFTKTKKKEVAIMLTFIWINQRKEKRIATLRSKICFEGNKEGGLIEARVLIGSDGTEYLLEPFLGEEIGLKVEKWSGIILKRVEGGKFSSFLGGGTFGKFYVAQKKVVGSSVGGSGKKKKFIVFFKLIAEK